VLQNGGATSVHFALTPKVDHEMLSLPPTSQLCIYQCLTALIWNFARLFAKGLHGYHYPNLTLESADGMQLNRLVYAS
jgi:hypothetical protein